jgi:hypothetical protein
MEKHYVFLINNKVANILVFAEQDDEFAQRIAEEKGYDAFVWIADATMPSPYATYNGSEFVELTEEEMFALGLSRKKLETPAE